jgi:protein-tyrosine phosphatase
VGNICRSPVAQFQLQQYLPGKVVKSAGLAAVVGHDVDAHARAIALASGLDIPTHQAQQVTPELCRWADLILVMEQGHRERLCAISPALRGKIFLLGDCAGRDGFEIRDPYGKSMQTFEHVQGLITKAVQGWAKRLGSDVNN